MSFFGTLLRKTSPGMLRTPLTSASTWARFSPLASSLQTIPQQSVFSQQVAGAKTKTKKYKLKTHKGTAKRTKINGYGQIMHWHAGKNHLNRKKRSNRLRRLRGSTFVHPHNERMMMRALGVGRPKIAYPKRS